MRLLLPGAGASGGSASQTPRGGAGGAKSAWPGVASAARPGRPGPRLDDSALARTASRSMPMAARASRSRPPNRPAGISCSTRFLWGVVATTAKDGTHRAAGGRDGQQEMFTAEMTVPKLVGVLHGIGQDGETAREKGSMPSGPRPSAYADRESTSTCADDGQRAGLRRGVAWLLEVMAMALLVSSDAEDAAAAGGRLISRPKAIRPGNLLSALRPGMKRSAAVG